MFELIYDKIQSLKPTTNVFLDFFTWLAATNNQLTLKSAYNNLTNNEINVDSIMLLKEV